MSESILSDGSVETINRWTPAGAQGNFPELTDGDQYILAIRIHDRRGADRWQFHTVTARCDSETAVSFDLPGGEPFDEFNWSEVDWFLPCEDIDLPFAL